MGEGEGGERRRYLRTNLLSRRKVPTETLPASAMNEMPAAIRPEPLSRRTECLAAKATGNGSVVRRMPREMVTLDRDITKGRYW